MAQVIKKTNTREEIRDAAIIDAENKGGNEWSDNTIKGILKSIQWPNPLNAIKDAGLSMAASVFIGGVLYLYGYAISQAIAMLVQM